MSRHSSSSPGSPMAALSLSNTSSQNKYASISQVKWDTLIDNALAFIDSRPRPFPLNRMEKPFVPAEFTSRESLLEVCAVEICPSYPEFMVVGTYALVGKGDKTEHEAQIRKGTLAIVPVAAQFKATYAGMLPPLLDKKDFPAAILDLHFHPNDDALLGVATSGASIYFFRLLQHASILDRRVEMKLLPLGYAKIADNDEHGLTHLITQFCWIPTVSLTGTAGVDDQLVVSLAATVSSGDVQIVKLGIPGIREYDDHRFRLQSTTPNLEFSQVYLRKHDQEAWTVSTFDIPSPPGTLNRLLLSGGDDSALKTTLINLTIPDPARTESEILATPAINSWIDVKSHAGGVTAILPLPPTTIVSLKDAQQLETAIPVLTGSYDDTIRLFLVNPSTLLRRLILELHLGGGVWRLKLMDDYGIGNKRHFLILASCMHAGVRILRLCLDVPVPDTITTTTYSAASNAGWTLDVVARFESGHKSMVYACDFRRESKQEARTVAPGVNNTSTSEERSNHSGTYTIVSTSFYDKKICTWAFTDQVRKEMIDTRARALGEAQGSWEQLGDKEESTAATMTPTRMTAGKQRIPSMSTTATTTTNSSGKDSFTLVGWVKEDGEWRMK